MTKTEDSLAFLAFSGNESIILLIGKVLLLAMIVYLLIRLTFQYAKSCADSFRKTKDMVTLEWYGKLLTEGVRSAGFLVLASVAIYLLIDVVAIFAGAERFFADNYLAILSVSVLSGLALTTINIKY